MKVRELNQQLSEAPYSFGSRVANRIAGALPFAGLGGERARGQHASGTEANTLFSQFQNKVARAGGNPNNVSRQYLIQWLTTPPNNYPSAIDMVPDSPTGRLNRAGIEQGIMRTVQADVAGGTVAYHQLNPEGPNDYETALVDYLHQVLQQRQAGDRKADMPLAQKLAIDKAFVRNGQEPMNWEELLPKSKTNPGYQPPPPKPRGAPAPTGAAPTGAAPTPTRGRKSKTTAATVDYSTADQMISDVLFNKMSKADRDRLVMNLVSKIGARVGGA